MGLLGTIGGIGGTIFGGPGGGQIGGLIGGLLDGNEETNGGAGTTNRTPWTPAQPYLQNNLKTNQQLQDYYAKQPFNSQQKTSYDNVFSDLNNFRNNTAPGLMQFANNMMTGSYQRPQHSAPGMAGYSSAPQQNQGGGGVPWDSSVGSMGQWGRSLPPSNPQQNQGGGMGERTFSAAVMPFGGGVERNGIGNAVNEFGMGSAQQQQPQQAWQKYMQNNPDVAAAYAGRANDPNLASTVNMSPQEFAQTHYQKFGQNEQRNWGDPSTPGGGIVAPFSVNHGPENTYGKIDWNAMNPFSAQNNPAPAPAASAGGAGGGGLLGLDNGNNTGHSGNGPSLSGGGTGGGGGMFSNVNDGFNSMQAGFNTPAGAGVAKALQMMGYFGFGQQDPNNVSVTDMSTYGGGGFGFGGKTGGTGEGANGNAGNGRD